MLGKLLFRLVWGTMKLAIKFVLIPILISAAIGAVLGLLTEKTREGTPDADGRVAPVIRPER